MKIAKLPDNLQGKWIWTERKHHHATQHVLLRKEFTLDEIPGTAEIWLASQAKYILFVNGRFYSAGPTPHPANATYATRLDITHLMQVGKNDLAIHAFSDQTPCVAHKPDAPAIWLQLTCDGNVHVVTDESWLCLNAECYQESGVRASTTTPYTEILDLRDYPLHWQTLSTNSLITQSPLPWKPPKTAIPITESQTVIESEPDFNRTWDIAFLPELVAKGTFKQRNEVLWISFADCFKGKIPNGLYAAEAFIYCPTRMEPQIALCICDEPYKIFVNNQLVKEQAAPRPQARNYPNTYLVRRLTSEELEPQETQITLRKGWNRILVLQHCSNLASGMTIIWAGLKDNQFPIHRKPDQAAQHGWNLAGPLNAPFPLINPDFPLDSLPKTPFLSSEDQSRDIAPFYFACQFKATQKNDPSLKLPHTLGVAETIILDFGKTILGLPEVRMSGSEGDIVDVVAGDHRINDEIIALEHGNRRNITTFVLKDGYEPVPCLHSHLNGFRYLMIIVRKAKSSVTLNSVIARIPTRDSQNNGRFTCSDQTFNHIWKISENTLNVTNQYAFLDSPTKDQAQCIPDAMIQSWAAYYTHGAYANVENALTSFARSQIETGELNAISPSGFIQAVPDYSLLWPVWLQRHIMHTADEQLLNTLLPNLIALLAYYDKIAVAPDGPLGSLKDLLGTVAFLDHDPAIDRDGIVTGLNAIYCRALLSAAWLADYAQQNALAHTYRKRADHVATQIKNLNWNPDEGLFADAYPNGQRSPFHSWQTNVLAIYGGLANPEDYKTIWNKLFTPNQPFELYSNGEYNNPYFKYFVLEAAFALGKATWGLDLIKFYWGKMIDAGATTWWELFDPDNLALSQRTISKCHGYGVSPNAFIISELVGIRPAQPGMKMVYFNPLPGIVTWVKATIPTPNGSITVNWELKQDGVFEASISANFHLEVVPILNPNIAESAIIQVSDKVAILEPDF